MTFYWKFVDTLVYNIATICGIIVELSQFLIKSFNENNGTTKVRKFITQTLFFVNKISSVAYTKLNEDTLPKVKKTQRRTSK
jgi:hypothetical protein